MFDTSDSQFSAPSTGRGEPNVLAVCPLCQTAYHPLTARIVAEHGDRHLLYLQCRACSSSVMAVVSTGTHEERSVGAVTDLLSTELFRFTTRPAVSADDVVDLVEWFTKHSSVQQILRREKADF